MDIIKKYSRQYKYYIRNTDTDTRDELQIFALTSMLQEAASVDAEHFGLGASGLDPMGYFWVLLRASIRLSAIPKWQDIITVDTWTNGVERLFSIRDFMISDQKGKFLGKATSSWAVVAKDSHRPQKISVLNNEKILEPAVSALGFSSPKLNESLAVFPLAPVLSKYVGYSEIDRNFHANNNRYIAWCLDAVGKAGIPEAKLAGIDINYISEVKIGETIDLFLAGIPLDKGLCEEAENSSMILGRHHDDQKTSFISIFYWK